MSVLSSFVCSWPVADGQLFYEYDCNRCLGVIR